MGGNSSKTCKTKDLAEALAALSDPKGLRSDPITHLELTGIDLDDSIGGGLENAKMSRIAEGLFCFVLFVAVVCCLLFVCLLFVCLFFWCCCFYIQFCLFCFVIISKFVERFG